MEIHPAMTTNATGMNVIMADVEQKQMTQKKSKSGKPLIDKDGVTRSMT